MNHRAFGRRIVASALLWRKGLTGTALVIVWSLAGLAPVEAARITIGSATGVPGSTVEIPVYLEADGIVASANVSVVFPEPTLSVVASEGTIPGANREGMCARAAGNKISGTILSGSVAPRTMVLCVIPFLIDARARYGTARLTPAGVNCFNELGQKIRCQTTAGEVQVLGSGVSPPLEMVTAPPYTLATMLRRGGPTVDDIVRGTPGPRGELPRSIREYGPSAVRALIPDRPSESWRRFLDRHTGSPAEQLDRYLIAEFSTTESRDAALEAARKDPLIEAAYAYDPEPTIVSQLPQAKASVARLKSSGTQSQYHLSMLKILEAQQLTPGWGLVSLIDLGADAEHPELRSRTTSQSTGGTWVKGGPVLPYYSANVAPDQTARDLRENQPQHETVFTAQCDGLNGPDGDDFINYPFEGHGSHIAGLVGANGLDNSGVRGACLHCGVQAIRAGVIGCVGQTNPIMSLRPTVPTIVAGLQMAAKHGAQVASLSFAYQEAQAPQTCAQSPSDVVCLELAELAARDVVVAIASGNDRAYVRFPARDPSVTAVGGVTSEATDGHSTGFWDDAADPVVGVDLNRCPNPPSPLECGSNNSNGAPLAYGKQAVVAPAKAVISTFKPWTSWINTPTIQCRDGGSPGVDGDGVGPCTGTSMSTPLVAGIYGLVRSIQPLLRRGDPFDTALNAPGVRDVVAETADRAKAGLPWDVRYGMGVPNARLAAERVLGTSNGAKLRNRLTPLFRLYRSDLSDYAAVANPQLAMALTMNGLSYVGHGFAREGVSIAGYSFPAGGASARASALVLTTPNPSTLYGGTAVPLHLLDKCEYSSESCADKDYILVSSDGAVSAALAAGYKYGGLQGYIAPACSPHPSCKPAGSEALYLQCKTGSGADCAVFLESEVSGFAGAGYTSAFASGQSTLLGYAWPIVYSDGDQLPDAFEQLIGTSAAHTDSDLDGVLDHTEYSFVELNTSDPCTWPRAANATCAIWPMILKDGFE